MSKCLTVKLSAEASTFVSERAKRMEETTDEAATFIVGQMSRRVATINKHLAKKSKEKKAATKAKRAAKAAASSPPEVQTEPVQPAPEPAPAECTVS